MRSIDRIIFRAAISLVICMLVSNNFLISMASEPGNMSGEKFFELFCWKTDDNRLRFSLCSAYKSRPYNKAEIVASRRQADDIKGLEKMLESERPSGIILRTNLDFLPSEQQKPPTIEFPSEKVIEAVKAIGTRVGMSIVIPDKTRKRK